MACCSCKPAHTNPYKHTHTFTAGRLEFRNNLALNKGTKAMPEKSFTVEFWARGQALSKGGGAQVRFSALATQNVYACVCECGCGGM